MSFDIGKDGKQGVLGSAGDQVIMFDIDVNQVGGGNDLQPFHVREKNPVSS